MASHRTDKGFFFSVVALVVVGLTIFISASMGLWTRVDINAGNLATKHIVVGVIGGLVALNLISRIPYRTWRTYSPLIFLLTACATLLVFVQGLGFSHGGATRWILVGNLSFQPSELLKIGYILYLAALLSKSRRQPLGFTDGALPFLVLSSIAGAILVAQPDIDTFAVLIFTGLSMLVASGARWRHVLLIVCLGIIGFGFLAYSKPYIAERLLIFMDSDRDALGSGYQIQQSLIAIGSGGLFGRGFGQSVQKFGSLPEPIGDSIFSVAAEEFGFLGSISFIALLLFFTSRGLFIAQRAPDSFGRLTVVGIVILIVSQSFVNIGAMLGLLPLSGIPLLFVSHGGTALLTTLAGLGIVFNISRHSRS
jgi:cell division protein FtsW